jgi:hypothetical protein
MPDLLLKRLPLPFLNSGMPPVASAYPDARERTAPPYSVHAPDSGGIKCAPICANHGALQRAVSSNDRPLVLTYGYHEDRTPTHGYEPTCEAAMLAFAKSWHRDT